jgi:uncharacterized damage-inducible protein DinB
MAKKQQVRIDEITLMRGWSDWLSATRRGYLDALLKLPKKARTKKRGASFESFQGIFMHIVDNNIWWLESVPRNRQALHEDVTKRKPSGPELRRFVRRIERSARTLMSSLTTRDLNRKYDVRGTGDDGKPWEMTCSFRTIFWHLLEEELQHRGELNALFWQMDIDAPTRAWFSSELAD